MAALTAWKEKCIITYAFTRGATFPQQSKYIPIKSEQILDEAKAARDARRSNSSRPRKRPKLKTANIRLNLERNSRKINSKKLEKCWDLREYTRLTKPSTLTTLFSKKIVLHSKTSERI